MPVTRGSKNAPTKRASGVAFKRKLKGKIPRLKPDCRCKCAVVCLITGRSEIKIGKSATYRVEINQTKNTGCVGTCKEPKGSTTEWRLQGHNPKFVTLKDAKKTTVKVMVKVGAAVAAFTLIATPVLECTCKPKKTGRQVACSVQPDSVSIMATN